MLVLPDETNRIVKDFHNISQKQFTIQPLQDSFKDSCIYPLKRKL